MTTEIKDRSSSYGPHFLAKIYGGWVNFNAHGPGRDVTATMPRADFLAAVETECGVRIVPADAIVIERAELPEVTVMQAGEYSAAGLIAAPESAKDAREAACAWLALAEYLATHPPVSDEDVETLAGLLESAKLNDSAEGTYRPAARRLLATGKVTVTR